MNAHAHARTPHTHTHHTRAHTHTHAHMLHQFSASFPDIRTTSPGLPRLLPGDWLAWPGLVWCCRAPQGVYYEKAIRFRRWAADHVQSLIEGTYGRRMKAWGGIVDSFINNIMFETRDLHLRQEQTCQEGSTFTLEPLQHRTPEMGTKHLEFE